MSSLKRFLGPNAGYVIELLERYRRDPTSVHPQVRESFESWSPDLADLEEISPRPPLSIPAIPDLSRILALLSLVQAIRDLGHLAASVDPLGLRQGDGEPFLEPESHGLSKQDLQGLPASSLPSHLVEGATSAEEVVSRLRQIYCATTGYEFGHIRSAEERHWLQQAVESGEFKVRLDPAAKRNLLWRLTQVETFERFLHRTFPGRTWFSLEGNDMLVPLLDEIIWQADCSELGTVIIGMAHRGRLNVLTHIFDKPYAAVLAEFTDGYRTREDNVEYSQGGWMRDVKYHMGARRTLPADGSGELTLILLPNPSHVEMVDPVVVGAVRASQEQSGTGGAPIPDEDAAMAIVIHGDAAFAGQGIVAETLNLSQLPGYRTGGTVHIITNNQIGFTTEPQEAHSTQYPTDVARGYDIPVVHVNADDVEACLAAAHLACAYRQRFRKDFVIDLVGYRRYGHNEGDEPGFTQPLMYEAIRRHPTVRTLWSLQLTAEGVVSSEESEAMVKDALARLEGANASAPGAEKPQGAEEPLHEPSLSGPHNGGQDKAPEFQTAVPADVLLRLNEELHRLPEGFRLHPKLERPFQRRREALVGAYGHPSQQGQVDWAHAEALAFASILADGVAIRVTGQDTERGTFSQRHALLHDVATNERFTPLQAISIARASFAIYNSPLSELSALAYEYGYSVNARRSLVLWEAQYGDFVNNAQGVIDEFLVSAQAKWGQRSGLVLLLPHGHEGQGPDHSSAHLGRFLQLAAGNNIQVAYCTTAAQYFHLLRRQAALINTDPRPLVVMTAKSLLRHPMARSTLQELAEGTFQSVIDDPGAHPGATTIRRVILCSGKVFVDLVSDEAYSKGEQVAIIRLEDLYPFPKERLAEILARYNEIEEAVWLQEGAKNRGAWSYVAPKLQEILKPGVPLTYIGRPALPSPAAGSSAIHKLQQEHIIRQAFSSPPVASRDEGDMEEVRHPYQGLTGVSKGLQ